MPATLTPVEGSPQGDSLAAHITDISFSGARVRAEQPIPVGSIWRLRFQSPDLKGISHSLLVRSCRSDHNGTFHIGGEYVVEPAALRLAGVTSDALTGDIRELAEDGAEPRWELRSHIVAHEALSITALCAVSISADKDLCVGENISDCTLDVTGRLVAPYATLVGGTAHILRGATLGELGAPDGIPTTIVLGESLRSSMMIAAATAVLATRRTAIERLQCEIDALKAKGEGGLDHADRERLTVMADELQQLRRAYATMDANTRTIRQDEAKRRLVRLEVARAIHPRVTIIAGDSQITLTTRLAGPVTLALLPDGGFDIVPTSGEPGQPIAAVANVFRRAA
jgi:hypothetical protein